MLAVPKLSAYTKNSGIGRVLRNLQNGWNGRVQCQEARFKFFNLPVLRNIPYGVAATEGSDLVFLPQLTGTSALATTKMPSLVVVHDIGVIDCPEDKQDMDWSTLQIVKNHLRSLHFASHIVAVSHFTRARLIEHLPRLEGKISVMPNAVDDTFWTFQLGRDEALSAVQRHLGTTLKSPLLIYVGSEIPRKNMRLLLKVLKRTQEAWPQAQLLKVGRAGGETYRRQTLAAMAELDLEAGRDVIFLQDIDDGLLACAYTCADVFVSASLYEGFGLPAAEAAAVGLPVVTSNRGSFPEIVAGSGCVVEPQEGSFVEAVLKTLEESSPHRRQERQASQSWSRSAERYLDIIDRLIANRPA